jgi:hypothetical protein
MSQATDRSDSSRVPGLDLLRLVAVDGVGDLKFAIKLKALSEEYEGDAKRTEAGSSTN